MQKRQQRDQLFQTRRQRMQQLLTPQVKDSLTIPRHQIDHRKPPVKPVRVIELPTGKQDFNPCLSRYGNGWVMVYRRHEKDSILRICRMKNDFTIIDNRPLRLPRKYNRVACEDPRFFWLNGKPHVSFSLMYGPDDIRMCYGMLSKSRLVHVTEPQLSIRKVEKNWLFFQPPLSNDHCVLYSTLPHKVHCLNRDRKVIGNEPWNNVHELGVLRGGASPIHHNGEFYHFCHNTYRHNAQWWYGLCLYTFEATSPFRPNRMVRAPLLLPDRDDAKLADKAVVYPCGAVLHDDRWYISYGYFDRQCRIAVFSAQDVESVLEKLPCSISTNASSPTSGPSSSPTMKITNGMLTAGPPK